MASGLKLLIDTNVLIGLEDWKATPPSFAKLQSLSSKHGCQLYVHEAALSDIARDSDLERRKTTLSKVDKFLRLSGIQSPGDDELTAKFGRISKPNDHVDVQLLYALELGAIDFLVTEDQGIHARAKRASDTLADRVLFVGDAVALLTTEYEPKAVRLPMVEEVPAHGIDANDDIFVSLREGYPDFDLWWRDKCIAEHRPCWILTVDRSLAGLIVRKDESEVKGGVLLKGLKLCTFKVKPEFRGEKLGELLLKQALWFAQRNSYDYVYLTTFPEQSVLVSILEYYGFERSGPDVRGELTLRKRLSREKLSPAHGTDLYSVDRLHYPRFVAPPEAPIFCVPIRPGYHDVLFPELVEQLSLFDPMGYASPEARKPGNTIRKVYLCRSKASQLAPGSIMAFYMSRSKNSNMSQSLTTVGVVERVLEISDLDDLIRLTGKRSVYSGAQLGKMLEEDNRPVKAIDFLLLGHLSPPMALRELVARKVLKGPPQSITRLASSSFDAIRPHLDLGFEV